MIKNMGSLTLFLVLAFGSIVGSFLNVVLLRKNTGESFVNGSSRCFSCGTKLDPIEMIPIFSFLFQRGTCRHCGSKISLQYPLIEFIEAIIALLIYRSSTSIEGFLFYFVAFTALFLIAAYDTRNKIIETHFWLIFSCFALFEALFRWSDLHSLVLQTIVWDVISSLGIAFFFYALWFMSHGKWMGLGDSYLALSLAIFLGFQLNIIALFLAFWIGSIVGVVLLLLSRSRFTLKSEIPFGPFLALGAFLAWYFHAFFIEVLGFFL